MVELPYIISAVVIVLVLMVPNYFRIRRAERKAEALLGDMKAQDRVEPATIRPHIDPARCMGSGGCATACPEKDVIRVIGGTAQIVNGAACIGHGACVTACPTQAIELVFGSARRGVDLPSVSRSFETNVPGLYIAGELGGMGLVANAVEQGTQAVHNAAQGLEVRSDVDSDIAIIGAGPAGLAAALTAKELGLRYHLLEQETLGGAILHYPRQKMVMTRPVTLKGYGKLKIGTLRKEELLALFQDVVQKTGLVVYDGQRVESVVREDDGAFRVTTTAHSLRASRVVLCVGRRGTPRTLGVPGEELSKVTYRLIDAELYQGQHVLVVGGGDSAVEAAVSLSEQPGNTVTLSYRGAVIDRAKPANRQALAAAEAEGKLRVLLSSQIEAVLLDRVRIHHEGVVVELPNDFVFALIGGVLPTEFLKRAGVEMQTHFGKRVVSSAAGRSAPQ